MARYSSPTSTSHRCARRLSGAQARELAAVCQGSGLPSTGSGHRKPTGSAMRQGSRRPLSLAALTACTLLLGVGTLCTCDTKTPSTIIINHHHHQRRLSSQPPPPPPQHQLQRAAGSTKSTDRKLSLTQDEIEMQHFKTKPASRVFVKNRRPSKFDSGSLVVDLGPLGLRNPAKLSSIKKVDDSMRQILRLHENALLQQASSSSPYSSSSPAASGSGAGPPQAQQQVLQLLAKPAVFGAAAKSHLKRLRVISRSPVQVASSLIQRPNKVVSHMLSYISAQPVGAAKLLDLVAGSMLDGRNLSSKLKFASFEGRSNQNFPNLVTPYPFISSLLKPSTSGAEEATPAAAASTATSLATTAASILQPAREALASQVKSSLIGDDADEIKDLMADSSSLSQLVSASGGPEANLIPRGSEPSPSSSPTTSTAPGEAGSSKPEAGSKPAAAPSKSSAQKSPLKLPWFIRGSGGNQAAQSYLQNSFRDLIMLSQLPILSSSHISTAPSVLEKKQHTVKKNKNTKLLLTDDFRKRAVEELYRYAYILATGVRNKKDPLKALSSKLGLKELNLHQRRRLGPSSSSSSSNSATTSTSTTQRSLNQLFSAASANRTQLFEMAKRLRSVLAAVPLSRARPRGVVWDLATDPSLAVTIFHLLERARVALPLGFMLMPIVQMMRHPLNGINVGRILPARASHRSVDYEELAKRLDVADKLLSRALRSTHRELVTGL